MEEDLDLQFKIEAEPEEEQDEEQKEEDLEDYNFEIQTKNFSKLLVEEEGKEEEDEEGFEEEEVKGGEQFGAVRPWLGALCAPNSPPKNNSSPPDQALEPSYVFGYRCGDCRDNIHYLKNSDEIVYMSASIGIVLNKKSNKQRWFGCGDQYSCKQCHNDDILSIAVHPNRNIVASGQVGKNPSICVWDSQTMKTLAKFNQGVNTRAVKTIGFSKCGKYIATTAADNDNSVYIFEWEQGKCLGSQKSGDDPIIDLDFSTTNSKQLATAGKRGMKFWDFSGKVSYHKGIFGKEKMADMTSVQYLSDGKAVSGSVNGMLYVWMGNSCAKTVKAHKGFISAIAQGADDRVITGGNDGIINIFSKDLKLEKHYQVGSSAVGIDESADGKLIVGLRNGAIVEILPDGTMLRYLQSHSDGEVWGLAICPQTGYILTSADDNKVLVYDPVKCRCIGKTIINSKKGPSKKVGAGASSLSNLPPNQQARAVAISKSGNVAIGINNGSVQIRESVKKLNVIVATKTEPKEWIEAMRYSPDDSLLAVSSHDNNIYIYKTGSYNLLSVCKGHTSYITSVDFSLDSSYIQTACGAYDYLFFNVRTGEQMKSGGSMFRDEKWATFSSKLGWWVQGIFPSGVDGTHVNGVERSNDESLVVVSDDWGLVNLYRNPALDGNKAKSFVGHSEHVVRAAFDQNDKFVYSIGGYDQTLIQWKLI